MSASHLLILTCCLVLAQNVRGQTQINCQRPPQLVDPSLCCRDGGRDQITEQCAQKIVGSATKGPPSIETATCLAECILTTSNYITEPQKINATNIRNNLSAKFSDKDYVEAMSMAFTKCEPQAQQRLALIQQQQRQQPKCSPFSAILLGCTYMEYFKNCPANRWTQSTECALAKTFVTQCGLGA